MELRSDNPRITDVNISDNLQHLSYYIDGHYTEIDGEFNFFGSPYEGLTELALVRRPDCYDENGDLNENCEKYDDGGVIEEILFKAFF